MLTIVLHYADAVRSIEDFRQDITKLKEKLREVEMECLRRMQLQEELTYPIRIKEWDKATASKQKFEAELKQVTEEEMSKVFHVFSLGRQALDDMNKVHQSLVISVGELIPVITALLSSYSDSVKETVNGYRIYMRKLERRGGFKTEIREIEDRMESALGSFTNFVQVTRLLLSAMNDVDKTSDGYPYLKECNKLSTLGRRIKIAVKDCLRDTKVLNFGFKPMKTLKESVMEDRAGKV